MTDLLIITCSKRKKDLVDAPAIEVYDGPVYRMLRKREPKDLQVAIISGKYGLLKPEDKIAVYDQIMTVNFAHSIRAQVSDEIAKSLREITPSTIFVNLPFPYSAVISPALFDALDDGWTAIFASGTQGRRMHQLSEWLKSREATA